MECKKIDGDMINININVNELECFVIFESLMIFDAQLNVLSDFGYDISDEYADRLYSMIKSLDDLDMF